jgi:PAS domain S-box-containing protein
MSQSERPTEAAVRDTQGDAWLEAILDCLAQPVSVVDHDGLLTYLNPAAVAALGYDDLSELKGKPGHETAHYKRPDGSPYPVEECPMSRARETGETVHSDEDWFVRRDGSMFPVSYASTPIDTPRGPGVVVAFTDIGDELRVQRVLRDHDAILETVPQPVYVVDHERVIRYANPAAVDALGYDDLSEMVGRNGHWLLHYKRPDGSPLPIEECQFTPFASLDDPPKVGEDAFVRKDGSLIPMEFTASPIASSPGVGMVIAFTDIRERREAERAARERDVAHARAEELRAARRRIIEAADAARAQLERDLHDGAQQQFVSALLNLQMAERQAASDPNRARELRKQAAELATSGVAELRRLAAGIHPAVLTDHGLKPAIEALAARLPLPVSVRGDLAERLPAPVEASVYFFVSEALTNVVKHAKADDATVRLGGEKGCLTVEVRDDGVGGAQVSDGSGLPGLDDRIAALDGTLELRSPPGGGTLLRARIPLP